MKINKKRAVAILALTAMAASAGFMAGRAVAEEMPAEVVIAETASTKTSLGEFVITAYCPCSQCCGEWADGLTASGTIANEGTTCAVDPTVIPLGTTIEIDGVKYVAEDVGGTIKGNRVDICFNDHRSAVQYGVKIREVFVIQGEAL